MNHFQIWKELHQASNVPMARNSHYFLQSHDFFIKTWDTNFTIICWQSCIRVSWWWQVNLIIWFFNSWTSVWAIFIWFIMKCNQEINELTISVWSDIMEEKICPITKRGGGTSWEDSSSLLKEAITNVFLLYLLINTTSAFLILVDCIMFFA